MIGNEVTYDYDGIQEEEWTGCPFLALSKDGSTRYSFPSPGNYCHWVHPQQPVQLNHQKEYCLSIQYLACPVILAEWKGSIPDYLYQEALKKKSIGREVIISWVAIGLGILMLLVFLVFTFIE